MVMFSVQNASLGRSRETSYEVCCMVDGVKKMLPVVLVWLGKSRFGFDVWFYWLI